MILDLHLDTFYGSFRMQIHYEGLACEPPTVHQGFVQGDSHTCSIGVFDLHDSEAFQLEEIIAPLFQKFRQRNPCVRNGYGGCFT